MERRVEFAVDPALGGKCLGERQAFELGTELGDLSLELTGVDGAAGPGESAALAGGEDAGDDRALVGRGGAVMALEDLRAKPFAPDQPLLGEEQVREEPIELPDPVQHRELAGGVET